MQLIADSIDSVLKFTKCVSYEILVIDNNTQDLSALNSYGDMVKVIQMDKNLGFGCDVYINQSKVQQYDIRKSS